MKEVKYDSVYKYIDECYCSKKQTIQLGWDGLLYAHIVAIIVSILLSILFFVAAPIGVWTLFFPGFTALFVGLTWLDYRWCLKDMQKEGHSLACSKKVARQAMWRESLYSHYVINVKVINKPNKSRLLSTNIALLLWVYTIVVNGIYFIGFNGPEGGFRSIIFPLLFIVSILASTALLIMVRQKSRPVTVMCVLNILSSSLLLSLYTAIALPSFL